MCAGDQGKEGPSPKDYRHDENYPGVGEETPAPKLIRLYDHWDHPVWSNWLDRKRNGLTFHLVQIFSGHGFEVYLHWI